MESEQSNINAVCDSVDRVKNVKGIELFGDSTGSSEMGTFVQTPEKDLWATQSGLAKTSLNGFFIPRK